jgi:alpha-glucosidase (family GH31 glycosyl hydrolase)
VQSSLSSIDRDPSAVVLRRGALRVEITLQPFELTIHRGERRLVRSLGAWAADGAVHDHFIQFTEGVVAREEVAPHERAVSASEGDGVVDRVTLVMELDGGRRGRLEVGIPAPDQVTFEFVCDRDPLRLALDWRRRGEERFVGLGARHCTQFDQAGRFVQLGADRRYTGPDCPAELLADGGIPQGDCAPVPWLISSRGYAVLVRSAANGIQFDLSGERVSVSSRSSAGPLAVDVFCDPTPAARLRALCRSTGFPAVLPEWSYGYWKSRDVYEHQDDVLDDYNGLRAHDVPVDAIVLDSPWATQYNTWKFNPHQFPDAPGMVRAMREDGVRTVVWVTPWVNLDSRDGQIPPQPESERLHREPASNYAPGAAAGHFVKQGGEPFVTQWWMGTGSPVDFTSEAAERWWREQVMALLALGVEGIKADDGEGYYIPADAQLADGRSGAEGAWSLGGLHRESLQRALDEVHPGAGAIFARSGWTGQQSIGFTWAGDQASDFWSLRVLVVATLSAACSGFSNWSHDIGGYLGHRLVERCPPELLLRWVQFGCFTPLMHAHGRMPQEPWKYSEHVLDAYRAYVLLHEQLVPYVRAAARTAALTGLPIIRPLCLTDPGDARGWAVGDAYGYGPALWVAPVLEDEAREREVVLPRGSWIETWSGSLVQGGSETVVATPVERIPVWVRDGSIVVTYPAAHVARGLGDVPESERPLEATLWGTPRLGHTAARLADGTRISWRRGRWSVSGPGARADREIAFREIGV